MSFTEGVTTAVSPSSAEASICSAPPSPPVPASPPGIKDGGSPLTEPQAPRVRRPAAERGGRVLESLDAGQAPPHGRPALQPPQGAGSGRAMRGRSPAGQRHQPTGLGAVGAGGGRGAPGEDDRGECDLAMGSCPSRGMHLHGRPGGGGTPVFTLTSAQLQVSEEFIDDDPADISFFAGGSEAFSFPYGGVAPLRAHPGSAPSSPDGYSPGAAPVGTGQGFDFEGEGGFEGDMHPSDTSELFEVKAQASLMQSLLSASGSSSLSNLPLHGRSEASSLANFPAHSVRSEASSAFQFSDIIDQLEQLSYPPTTAEDSSSADTDSWGSEAPLDMSLYFSTPFAQTGGERVLFDLQNNMKNLSPGEQIDQNLS